MFMVRQLINVTFVAKMLTSKGTWLSIMIQNMRTWKHINAIDQGTYKNKLVTFLFCEWEKQQEIPKYLLFWNFTLWISSYQSNTIKKKLFCFSYPPIGARNLLVLSNNFQSIKISIQVIKLAVTRSNVIFVRGLWVKFL